MKSPATEIAFNLAQYGFGVFGGQSEIDWSINVSVQPDLPSNSIAVTDTGGQEPDTEQLDLLRPTFQVRVRSLHFNVAYAKCNEICQYLKFLSGNIEDHRYLIIVQESDILDIGKDDNDRSEVTCNFRATRSPLM